MAAADSLVLHGGLKADRCKSCKASIVWAKSYSTGKPMPLQADDAGAWTIENGIAKHLGPPAAQLEIGAGPGPTRYSSHFSTCPNASDWRKSDAD